LKTGETTTQWNPETGTSRYNEPRIDIAISIAEFLQPAQAKGVDMLG
jgi:hypothetical protein